jgi:hypothetical protein
VLRSLQISITLLMLSAQTTAAQSVAALLTAYPDHLVRIDGNDLVWKDGTRMPIDDGRGSKPHEALLATADIKDMFIALYPRGAMPTPPLRDADPGRARNAAVFDKMYGSCNDGSAIRHLVDVAWLPKKWGKPLKVTRINGVADKLAAVSRDLDALPSSFDRYLYPSAGTYVCRPIAGTDRVSAHGHGIAIDLSTATTDYWRWARNHSAVDGDIPYRNRLPLEIVEIFERHGFIWGGKWYHYDTMHFEYRPELIAPTGAKKAD